MCINWLNSIYFLLLLIISRKVKLTLDPSDDTCKNLVGLSTLAAEVNFSYISFADAFPKNELSRYLVYARFLALSQNLINRSICPFFIILLYDSSKDKE